MVKENEVREEMVQSALMAFWMSVAERNPNAKPGDISIETTVKFEMVARLAIAEWVAANVEPLPPATIRAVWDSLLDDGIQESAIIEVGAGIYCIEIKSGPFALWFGTANANWGASVILNDDVQNHGLKTECPSSCADPKAVASAIVEAVLVFEKQIVFESLLRGCRIRIVRDELRGHIDSTIVEPELIKKFDAASLELRDLLHDEYRINGKAIAS